MRLSPKIPRLALKPTQPPIKWVPGFFPGGKVAGHEVDQSTPSSTKIKNHWSYTYAPPIYLHDIHKDNLTFLPFNKE